MISATIPHSLATQLHQEFGLEYSGPGIFGTGVGATPEEAENWIVDSGLRTDDELRLALAETLNSIATPERLLRLFTRASSEEVALEPAFVLGTIAYPFKLGPEATLVGSGLQLEDYLARFVDAVHEFDGNAGGGEPVEIPAQLVHAVLAFAGLCDPRTGASSRDDLEHRAELHVDELIDANWFVETEQGIVLTQQLRDSPVGRLIGLVTAAETTELPDLRVSDNDTEGQPSGRTLLVGKLNPALLEVSDEDTYELIPLDRDAVIGTLMVRACAVELPTTVPVLRTLIDRAPRVLPSGGGPIVADKFAMAALIAGVEVDGLPDPILVNSPAITADLYFRSASRNSSAHIAATGQAAVIWSVAQGDVVFVPLDGEVLNEHLASAIETRLTPYEPAGPPASDFEIEQQSSDDAPSEWDQAPDHLKDSPEADRLFFRVSRLSADDDGMVRGASIDGIAVRGGGIWAIEPTDADAPYSGTRFIARTVEDLVAELLG